MSFCHVSGWRPALMTWGERQRREGWAWGDTDCCTLTRKGLQILFERDVINAEYSSRQGAHAWMQRQGATAARLLEARGALLQPAGTIDAGDVIVRPGSDEGMPRIALALDSEVLLTSDPIQGPHWIAVKSLRRRHRAYRFGA
tara:strand:+ start:400 stop:828 length:429 start_codon:yes stop_codon:yes gene_type:complete